MANRRADRDIDELLAELRRLRIQEDAIIRQIEDIRERVTEQNVATPARTRQRTRARAVADGRVADNEVEVGNTVLVGDTVSFQSTRTTSAGQGIVRGWTNGRDPFLRIERTNGPHRGEIILRKESRVIRLHRQAPRAEH